LSEKHQANISKFLEICSNSNWLGGAGFHADTFLSVYTSLSIFAALKDLVGKNSKGIADETETVLFDWSTMHPLLKAAIEDNFLGHDFLPANFFLQVSKMRT